MRDSVRRQPQGDRRKMRPSPSVDGLAGYEARPRHLPTSPVWDQRSSGDSSLRMVAGFPATIVYGGTSLVTTAPAATIAPSLTVTPRSTKAPAPIQASSQILTGLSSREIWRGCPLW